MRQKFTLILFILTIILFPGCYRYINWAKSTVEQGCSLETCCQDVQPYIRSARIYDQFTTLGLFDALLLDQAVLQAYICAHQEKYSLSNDQYQKLLEQQYEDYRPYISFYLLSVIPGNVGILLTDENPLWTVLLKVGCTYYKPAKLKLIELPQEYRYFFGKRLTVSKKHYLVQFNAFDEHDVPIFSPVASKIELVLRRVGYQTSMEWSFDSSGQVIDYCSLDDNTLAYDIKTNL